MSTSPTSAKEIRFYRANGPYGFLSMLYKIPAPGLLFEDVYFWTGEAAYQYGKPKDHDVAEWIISAPKPHLVAMAAHGLLAFDVRKDWQQIKVPRMRAVQLAIVRQFPERAQMLLQTWPAKLIEESNTDSFWGIGKRGDGKNMLAVLWMELRETLRQEQCKHERLNEEGICRACGADCRGIGGGA